MATKLLLVEAEAERKPYQRMSRLIQRARYLFLESDMGAFELFNAVTLLTLGVTFLFFSPFPTFPAFYRVMALMLPSWSWGLILFSLGVIHFAGLIADHDRMRILALLMGMGLWACLTVIFALSGDRIVATMTFWLFGFSVRGFWRMFMQKRPQIFGWTRKEIRDE